MTKRIDESRLAVASTIGKVLGDNDLDPRVKGKVLSEQISKVVLEYELKKCKDFSISKLFALSYDFSDALNHGVVFVEGYSFAAMEAELRDCIAIIMKGGELSRDPKNYYSKIIEN